jgi:hypothetical protein
MTPTRIPVDVARETVKDRGRDADIAGGPMRTRPRTDPPTPAVLTVDGLGGVHVRVVASAPGAHALWLPAAPVPVRLLHRLAATLQPEGARALRGLLVAVAVEGGGLHPTRLDFVEDAAAIVRPDRIDEVVDRTPERQRRSAVRVETVLPYTFAAVIAERDWGTGFTVDLSTGGALVQGIEAGLPGDRLRGRLTLPSLGEPVRAQLRVMRVTPDGHRAIRVESIDERDRDRISRHIAERQRELLRMRRAA